MFFLYLYFVFLVFELILQIWRLERFLIKKNGVNNIKIPV